MADYKTIHGTKVRSYTTDPDNLITGEVWYDKTNNVLQFQAAGAASWASGGTLNTSRFSLSGAGTSKSEALAAGGYPPGPVSASTEEWTGPGTPIGGWSTGSDLNTARRTFAGAGENSSSGLAFGGTSAPGSEVGNTEAYNGTNWTEVNDMTTGRAILAGTGTQTSALAFGGNPITGKTESWNGTNWTEVNDLNTSRYGLSGAGADNTSALAFGGNNLTAAVGNTETWNGTNWTEVNDLNTARQQHGGLGTQTAALAVGGNPITGKTESWNGTNWTEVNDLNTARDHLGAIGSQVTALAFGGEPPYLAVTEEWDGTNWTEVADLNTARRRLTGNGTTTSGLAFGGQTSTVPVVGATEEWSSSSTTTKTISTD